MNIFVRKRIAIVILIMGLISMNMVTLASEISGLPVEDVSGKDCLLTFSLIDKTDGKFTDKVSITLLNRETMVAYEYNIKSLEYLNGMTIVGNVKWGDYDIAISYPNKGEFIVKNADGTEISYFKAETDEYSFDWVVCSANNNEQENVTINDYTTESSSQNNDVKTDSGDDNTIELEEEEREIIDRYIVDTGIEEANILWRNFLEQVVIVETRGERKNFMDWIKDSTKSLSNLYEEETGRSKEEYLKMTSFEQMLWYSTYVVPMGAITSNDYDIYCKNIGKWNSYAVFVPYNWFKSEKAPGIAEAYHNLMEWEYYYFIEHGSIINFMTGESSLKDQQSFIPMDKGKNDKDKEIEELKGLMDEELQSLIDEEERNSDEKGGGSTLAIVILLILIGLIGRVIICNKNKSSNDRK